MKVSDVRSTEGKYLKSEHLQGRRVTVTIASYQREMLGQGSDAKEKTVLYFQGKAKGMALNRINEDRLVDMFGDEMDDWVGQKITLGTERTQYQGKTVDGLRVVPSPHHQPQQNGGKPGLEHVVQQRSGYQLSEMRPVGKPVDDLPDDEVPGF